jgi:hypothetical protein
MKRCPTCNRTYTDESIKFCLEDGTPLLSDAPQFDPNATIVYTAPQTGQSPSSHPPAPGYPPEPPRLNQAAPAPQQQWSPPPPQPRPQKKSNAIWWILGIVAVLTVIGIGLFIMILAIASMSSSNSNSNQSLANTNSTEKAANRNAETSKTNGNYATGDSKSSLPSSFSDDFSSVKWATGDFAYGDIWYANDEYHMRSKDKTFLVMYAPSNDYSTENATVRVTARSVDSSSPSSGYGLIVHGEKSNDALEDYAFLIYSGEGPQFEVVMHKNGNQTTLVPWTKSDIIRSGTSPNQLGVRAKDRELSFYINGQYVTSISDSGNFKRGVAGFYTSDINEVVFDDLEITR